jgi:hypothetical protein
MRILSLAFIFALGGLSLATFATSQTFWSQPDTTTAQP